MVQVKSDDKEHLWRGISKRNKGKKSLESNARVHLVNGPSERHYYQDGNSYNLNLKVSSSNLPGCPLLLNINHNQIVRSFLLSNCRKSSLLADISEGSWRRGAS